MNIIRLLICVLTVDSGHIDFFESKRPRSLEWGSNSERCSSSKCLCMFGADIKSQITTFDDESRRPKFLSQRNRSRYFMENMFWELWAQLACLMYQSSLTGVWKRTERRIPHLLELSWIIMIELPLVLINFTIVIIAFHEWAGHHASKSTRPSQYTVATDRTCTEPI